MNSIATLATIGIDLAKNVSQVRSVDAAGAVVVRSGLRRNQVLVLFADLGLCLIGIEACAGAHFWARELTALGHEARLVPAAYVKPYVKRGKTEGEEDRGSGGHISRRTIPRRSRARAWASCQ